MGDFMKEILGHLLGSDFSLALFTASLMMAYFGFVISLLVHMVNRDAQSPRTPNKFSPKVAFIENWPRVLLNIFLIPLAIRFSTELLGMKAGMYTAVVVGFIIDRVAIQVLKRTQKDMTWKVNDCGKPSLLLEEEKQIAFFQEDLTDRVVSIGSYIPDPSLPTCTELTVNDPAFFLAEDEDEVVDLCTTVDTTTSYLIATFKRSDTTTYNVVSVDFIGGRPPRRPTI